MLLIVYFLALVAAGDASAYFIGLAVEQMWGSQASLLTFLALYFLTLYVAWILAVWLTKPKQPAAAALPTGT